MPDPIPPRDIDAERALLGSIIIVANRFVDLTAVLKAEYFYINTHRCIREAMNRLVEINQPIDYFTLCNIFNTGGRRKEIGGPADIM